MRFIYMIASLAFAAISASAYDPYFCAATGHFLMFKPASATVRTNFETNTEPGYYPLAVTSPAHQECLTQYVDMLSSLLGDFSADGYVLGGLQVCDDLPAGQCNSADEGWRWADGEIWDQNSYTNWAADQPDNTPNSGQYYLTCSGKYCDWNDLHEDLESVGMVLEGFPLDLPQFPFCLFSEEAVYVRDHSSAGPITSGGIAEVGVDTVINGFIEAVDNVTLRAEGHDSAKVTGTVTTEQFLIRQYSKTNNSILGGFWENAPQGTVPRATVPRLTVNPAANDGDSDLVVLGGQTLVMGETLPIINIQRWQYYRVYVYSGATLEIMPGQFHMFSLMLEAGSKIIIHGRVQLYVQDEIRWGVSVQQVFVNPATPDAARFFVYTDQTRVSDNNDFQRRHLHIETDNALYGLFVVGQEGAQIKSRVGFWGCVVGKRDVTIDANTVHTPSNEFNPQDGNIPSLNLFAGTTPKADGSPMINVEQGNGGVMMSMSQEIAIAVVGSFAGAAVLLAGVAFVLYKRSQKAAYQYLQ